MFYFTLRYFFQIFQDKTQIIENLEEILKMVTSGSEWLASLWRVRMADTPTSHPALSRLLQTRYQQLIGHLHLAVQ